MSTNKYSAPAVGVQQENVIQDGDIDYDFLEVLLDELDSVSYQLGASAGQFVDDKRERVFQCGYETYVSERQYEWLLDLYMRHVSKERRKEIFLQFNQILE
jgi:hypothetical protein